MLVSVKIKKSIVAEIKAKKSLIKLLEQEAKDYDVDNSTKIKQLNDVVTNYESISKQ